MIGILSSNWVLYPILIGAVVFTCSPFCYMKLCIHHNSYGRRDTEQLLRRTNTTYIFYLMMYYIFYLFISFVFWRLLYKLYDDVEREKQKIVIMKIGLMVLTMLMLSNIRYYAERTRIMKQHE